MGSPGTTPCNTVNEQLAVAESGPVSMTRFVIRCRVRGTPSYRRTLSYTSMTSDVPVRTSPVDGDRHVAFSNNAATPGRSPESSNSAYRWTRADTAARSADCRSSRLVSVIVVLAREGYGSPDRSPDTDERATTEDALQSLGYPP